MFRLIFGDSCILLSARFKTKWKEKNIVAADEISCIAAQRLAGREKEVGNMKSYFTISTRFLGTDKEKGENSEKKVGNIESYFTISTRFLGKDIEKDKTAR